MTGVRDVVVRLPPRPWNVFVCALVPAAGDRIEIAKNCQEWLSKLRKARPGLAIERGPGIVCLHGDQYRKLADAGFVLRRGKRRAVGSQFGLGQLRGHALRQHRPGKLCRLPHHADPHLHEVALPFAEGEAGI